MSMFIVIAQDEYESDVEFFGPYGEEHVAERAKEALAERNIKGRVAPLTNGLLAYGDMTPAPDPFNDWTIA